MQKQTLQFTSLESLAAFARQLATGYLMNTNRLTLTGPFSEAEILLAVRSFKASLIDTSEKVFHY